MDDEVNRNDWVPPKDLQSGVQLLFERALQLDDQRVKDLGGHTDQAKIVELSSILHIDPTNLSKWRSGERARVRLVNCKLLSLYNGDICIDRNGDPELQSADRQLAKKLRLFWLEFHADLIESVRLELKRFDDRVEELERLELESKRRTATADVIIRSSDHSFSKENAASAGVRHSSTLPASFVNRRVLVDLAVDAIREALLNEAVAPSIGLVGGGGFGKTTLATAISRIFEKDSVFDHILRTVVGKGRSDVTDAIVDLIIALRPDRRRPAFQSPEAAAEELSNVVAGQTCLFIIDDVWTEEQVEPFLVGCPGSVRLFTSRVPSILASSKLIPVGAMTPAEALTLLSFDLEFGEIDQGELRSLTKKLFQWPQLLSLANRFIRYQVSKGNRLVNAIDNYTRRLKSKGLHGLDPKRDDDRGKAIAICFSSSLEELSRSEMDRFGELCIFKESVGVPIFLVARLWQHTGDLDEFETQDLIDHLHGDLSLIETVDLDQSEVFLHGNAVAFMREVITQERKKIINDIICNHVILEKIEEYTSIINQIPYGWRYLIFHLRQAERDEAANALIGDYTWIKAFVQNADIQSLVQALEYEGQEGAVAEICGALVASAPALARTPNDLPRQVFGRLSCTGIAEIDRFVAAAVGDEDFEPRPKWPHLLCGDEPASGVQGHTALVRCATFSPNCQFVLTASWDGTAAIWDWNSEHVTHRLSGHNSPVQCADWSSDASHIVTASGAGDQSVRLWDPATGLQIAILGHHDARIRAAKFFPDSKLVLSAAHDKIMKIWDLEAHDCRDHAFVHPNPILTVSISPDGDEIATASQDRLLRIISRDGDNLRAEICAHEKWLRVAEFSPDGKLIATSSDDGTVALWNSQSLELVARLTGFSNGARSARFSPSGDALVLTHDRFASLYALTDLASPKHVGDLRGHTGQVLDAVYSSCGSLVATVSTDQTARVWDAKEFTQLSVLGEENTRVRSLAFSIRHGCILASCENGKINLYDSNDGQAIFLSSDQPSYEISILDPIEKTIYAVSSSGSFVSMDFKGAINSTSDLGFRSIVSGGSISKDGKALAIASEDASVRVYALDNGKLTETGVHTHAAAAKSCAMSKSGRILATCSDDRSVCVWDNASGEILYTFEEFSGAVLSVCISDEERWVAAVSSDMSVVLLDLREQKTLQTKVHTGSVTSIAFLGERFMVTASQDRTMKLFEIGSFVEIVSIEFDVPVSSIAVDGSNVAVGDNVGRVYAFDFSYFMIHYPRQNSNTEGGR